MLAAVCILRVHTHTHTHTHEKWHAQNCDPQAPYKTTSSRGREQVLLFLS